MTKTKKPLDKTGILNYTIFNFKSNSGKEYKIMKRIQTIETRDLRASAQNGGCGECQTSCQSACKTSCGVANQQCENK